MFKKKESNVKRETIEFFGEGLVLSPSLSEVNNLYRLNGNFESESMDYVHIKRGFSKKYAPILLKESFFLIKPDGFLLLEYEISREVDYSFVESQFWWLFKGNYEIISHEIKNGKGKMRVRKKKKILMPDDRIDKWTFGIITNGERDDWMEEIIASIKDLKIPHYEIIVCGKYKSRKENNFVYIPFNERAEIGWITKKKNLICERAQYENLCIIHDRLVFDKDWYTGMKRYGNAFELLGCVQKEKNTGELAGDWLTLGGPLGTLYKISRLNYSDWDYSVYLSGQLTILKRSLWKQVQWDETRYWDESEDADISFRAREMGYIIRFNPYSHTRAFTWRHGKIPLLYDRSKGLLPRDMVGRRMLRSIGRIAQFIPFLLPFLEVIYKNVGNTRLYKFFMYH